MKCSWQLVARGELPGPAGSIAAPRVCSMAQDQESCTGRGPCRNPQPWDPSPSLCMVCWHPGGAFLAGLGTAWSCHPQPEPGQRSRRPAPSSEPVPQNSPDHTKSHIPGAKNNVTATSPETASPPRTLVAANPGAERGSDGNHDLPSRGCWERRDLFPLPGPAQPEPLRPDQAVEEPLVGPAGARGHEGTGGGRGETGRHAGQPRNSRH